MGSTVFREPEPVQAQTKTAEPQDETRVELEADDIKPVEEDQDVLTALGIVDNLRFLPSEDVDNLREMKDYLKAYMKDKGLAQTVGGMRQAIGVIKEDLGLHEDADPQAVINRVGGLARSWKALSFIKELDERKKVLVKLISAQSAKEMDRIVMGEMEARKIWL